MSSEEKRTLAEWQTPQCSTGIAPQLTLYNSLTRNKDIFVPQNGNKVTWYICGPTVYDSSHMGHARSYMSFDIVRRVMQGYFGYDIQYVMNVTDVDDKIIKRSRQKHLINQYLSQGHKDIKDLIVDVLAALQPFNEKYETETNPDKKSMMLKQIAKVNESVTKLEKKLESGDKNLEDERDSLVESGKDILADWLDVKMGQNLTDHSIFTSLARKFENEFHQDMAQLGVLPPDVLTRVSEYVPEIVTYIQTIIDNGFAYEAQGNVYFNTVSFDQHPDHHYAKLVPEAFADPTQMANAMREGEGELSISDERLQQKRSPSDFALWKASKGGEPSWDSPWGKGRPGWHIECSVMAGAICGHTLDIHSGGFDLKFPHHDNEIAQSEAHYKCKQWVNYFLHAGTLRIEGLKMSKSLKNFISIREALKDYTARQLRLLFLLHNWNDQLDYSKSVMERALQFEKLCAEFFLEVKHLMRTHFKNDDQSYVKCSSEEIKLMSSLHDAKEKVHLALCDNIDTRLALETIRELISVSHVYVKNVESVGGIPNVLTLRNIAAYITRLLRSFGAIQDPCEIGFPAEGKGGDKEEMVMPYLTALADFREKVRVVAKEHKLVIALEECDKLRDQTLPNLGVRLEDKQPGKETVIKLVDREEILREVEQKRLIEEAKRLKKEQKKLEEEAKEKQKSIRPEEMFRAQNDKYSKFDDQGIPTHDINGEQISKKQRKKLEKMHELQTKKYMTHANGVV